MGYDFNLYEVTNYDWEESQKDFQVKEVLYLSNSLAMLISNWLYRNIHGLVDDCDKCYHYVEVYGWQLKDCLENLNTVLDEPDKTKRDLLALFYFPCMYTVPDIRDRLSEVINDDPDRQVFLYNLSVYFFLIFFNIFFLFIIYCFFCMVRVYNDNIILYYLY